MNYNKINYLIRFMPKDIIDFCEEVRESNNEKYMTFNSRKYIASIKTITDYVESFHCNVEEYRDVYCDFKIIYKGNNKC